MNRDDRTHNGSVRKADTWSPGARLRVLRARSEAGSAPRRRRTGCFMGLLDAGAWQGKIYLSGWVGGSGGDYPVTEPATRAELGRIGRATPRGRPPAPPRGAPAPPARDARAYTP